MRRCEFNNEKVARTGAAFWAAYRARLTHDLERLVDDRREVRRAGEFHERRHLVVRVKHLAEAVRHCRRQHHREHATVTRLSVAEAKARGYFLLDEKFKQQDLYTCSVPYK